MEKVGEAQLIEDSAGRLAISVPIRIKQRGRRKRVTLPGGETAAPKRPWDDALTPLQLALARGNRWLAMLESGEAGSLREIADREQQLREPHDQPDLSGTGHRGCHP